ncbi:MAG: FG-GAP repeat protein [Turneriella sp.]
MLHPGKIANRSAGLASPRLLITLAMILMSQCKSWGRFWEEETFTENTEVYYTVSGTVSGLSGTLVLQNNGGDDLTRTADGGFTFPTPLPAGSVYSVQVATNPSGQFCHVKDNEGELTSNVTSVLVQCSSTDFTWTQDAYLKASNAETNDSFGYSVAASGSTMVVGAYRESSNQSTVTNTDATASTGNSAAEAGAVYVFKRDSNGDWIQDAYLKASNAEAGDYFGYAVAVSGSTIVVGAYQEDSSQNVIANGDGTASTDNSAIDSGAVYVFKRNSNGDWIQDAYLKPSNTGANDYFGYSVAISGSTILVGAPQEGSSETTITNHDGTASADDSASNSGAVYVFRRDSNGDWIQDAYLKAPNTGVDDTFGSAVAISGTTIAVGAFGEDSNQTTITNTDATASADNSAADAGAVYVFKAF